MGSPTAEILASKIGKDTIPCKIVSSKKKYNQDLAGYIFNKKSPYLKLFNYHILQIIQNGLETEWFDMKKVSSDCIDDKNTQFRPFSYTDVISVFVLFATGCIIALFYSIFEYFYQSRTQSDPNCVKYKAKQQFIEKESR